MPQAGSGGSETYESDTEPPRAVEGDFWYDGISMRLRTRTGWRLVSGPSAADTSVLDPTV